MIRTWNSLVDATIVKLHRHDQGAKGDCESSHRSVQRRPNYQNLGATFARR
jgi:hypothetical protein